ncbi:MAG: SDR family NAD(P)-dependent oxidoreductase [Rhodospirillaceae bacterium]|nr:SDR family NAD(P)-dependent oxidoreductase [Rhodospirillaceae bacterium]
MTAVAAQPNSRFWKSRDPARSRFAATVTDDSRPSGRLAGRVALITGASRGIGAAVAVHFAREGAHCVLVARTVGGLEETDDRVRGVGGTATLVPFDLAEPDRIEQLAPALAQRFRHVDVIVGNAGVLGVLGPLADQDPETWQRVMDVNVTANWRLIRSFDRALRASDAGRAIFVTSGAAETVFPYWGAYAASKAALEMMAKVYAGEVARTRVRVNLIDPGVVRTAMRAHAFPGEDPTQHPQPENIAGLFVDLAVPDCTRNGTVLRAY